MDKALKLILAFALLGAPLVAQGILAPIMQVQPSSGGTPVLKSQTYIQVSGIGSSMSTNGSGGGGAITTAAGDYVIVWCASHGYTNGTITSWSMTDSLSNSWTALGFVNGSGNSGEMFVGAPSTTGSTNFTCTPNASSGIKGSITVLDYTGTSGTKNTSATANTTGTTLTSGSFTTTQRTLNIFIGAMYSVGDTWTAGTIGGNTATFVGGSQGTTGTSQYSIAEAYTSTGILTSATAVMTISTNDAVGTVVAVNY